MLQQTTVETVIPYFRRFVKRFPGVRALAAASEEEVLRYWSGLGYYKRARHLLAAARAISGAHRGRVPADRATLVSLPGIGPYTAAAVIAIAHGGKEIALDGNLKRVLARLAAYRGDPASAAGERRLRKAGLDLVEAGDPSVINQALMDLGASICTPRSPRCLLCPLEGHCLGKSRGLAERIPPARNHRVAVRVRMAAAVVDGRDHVLLRRRSGPLMDGMWEFPLVELSRVAAGGRQRGGGGAGEEVVRKTGEGNDGADVERALCRELAAGGVSPGRISPGGRVRHTITHHRIQVEIFQVSPSGMGKGSRARAPSRVAEGGPPGSGLSGSGDAGAEWRWVLRDRIHDLPLTGIARKIAGRLVTGGKGPPAGRRVSPRDSGRPSAAR
jgi:A/G-specific adenine glycosylase